MKNTLLALFSVILLSTPLAANAQQYGDFTYTSDGAAITITGYTGPGGAVTIPATITALPVTAIADFAFQNKPSLTSITIPGSVTFIGNFVFRGCTSLASATIGNGVTSIGDYAFNSCTSLTSLTIGNSVLSIGNYVFSGCTDLASVTIPGSLTSMGNYAFSGCISLASVTIGNSLTSIGHYAFSGCTRLTSVTIPSSVTFIGDMAFAYCASLAAVFFKGNPPVTYSTEFAYASNTVYYLPGTTGWGATFDGRPTSLWNPLMQTGGPSFGVGPAGFGFNITGTADIPIVIEAATSLANSWVPLESLNLTNGAFYFSDPNWTNYPARFYRIRSP